MLPSSFSPTSNFFILGDYQWELLCNSNKQLPLLFPSARCRGCNSEGLCHVDVRTDWSRHLQLHRLYLSHLEHHEYRLVATVLMSRSWRLYTASPHLSQPRLVFLVPQKDQYGDKVLKDGDKLTTFPFPTTPSLDTIQQLFNCEGWRSVIAVSVADGFI